MFIGKKVSTLYTLPNLCKDKQQKESGPSMIFFSVGPHLCTRPFDSSDAYSVNISLLSRKLQLFVCRVTVSRFPLNLPLITILLFIFYVVSPGVICHITLFFSLSGYPIFSYHLFYFCFFDFASSCVDSLLSRFPQ